MGLNQIAYGGLKNRDTPRGGILDTFMESPRGGSNKATYSISKDPP
jgi:hypothetical protein